MPEEHPTQFNLDMYHFEILRTMQNHQGQMTFKDLMLDLYNKMGKTYKSFSYFKNAFRTRISKMMWYRFVKFDGDTIVLTPRGVRFAVHVAIPSIEEEMDLNWWLDK